MAAPVPTDLSPLVVAALVLGVALTVSFSLTVGLSVYRAAARARRDRHRDRLREELLDRVFTPTAGWEPWVAGLSALEREVVESLLDEYLRELQGSDAERLRDLGEALGIPARSARRLDRRREYDRLQALTWLVLLQRPDLCRASNFTPRTPRERATVTRLYHDSDAPTTVADGLTLLLDGTDAPFTVFGQDTLYRVARRDPAALLSMAATRADAWPESLLVQVLEVCRELESSVGGGDISWLTATLEAESAAVRAASARALSGLGWREDLRGGRYLERLTGDPSPRVRAAVYRTLADWGDERALSVLAGALATETDARALVTGTDALARRRDRPDAPEVPAAAWAWSREQADYDRLARHGREVEP
ncbi:HEAT repeat domain-containing protein [Halorarius halobius]|uniref:HEAT repeat domain-containing protein n=1 Tax=Halorarius halobius TaxID=2962671 RepID=UPI0020CD07C8|nr:HEAT repeat domain-containing protein [Halorarius halobius]